MAGVENYSFCTIITADYAYYALALHDSLIRYNKNFIFSVFISKGEISKSYKQEFQRRNHVEIYYFQDLHKISLVKDLRNKYYENHHDAFRWGMKPALINFLLQSFRKVIYLDSDIYFFNNFDFLFQKLDCTNILLTPHWRSATPHIEYSNFVHNFVDGLYNAGFIAASRGAEPAMNWWAEMVLFKCEVNPLEGYYDDQRYLDLMPILFENVDILRHKGCNVANWNKILCRRSLVGNGEVIINNEFPIVFIHFTNTMLTGIFYENDTLLKPHLEQYRDNLQRYSGIDIIEQYLKKGKFKKLKSEDDFKRRQKSFRIVERSKSIIKLFYKKLI